MRSGSRALAHPRGDRLHQRRRLAGAGTGEDQQRPAGVVNHGALRCVQDEGDPRGPAGYAPVGTRPGPPPYLAVRRVPVCRVEEGSSRGSPVLVGVLVRGGALRRRAAG